TFNGGRGDDVVVGVLERAVLALDVGVDEPEFFAVVAEARGPDAAGVRVAAHVELALAGQRAGDEVPVGEIARVVNLHTGERLEGRGGDVVVVADAEDRGVGVEAGEDGVAERGHVILRDTASCQSTTQSMPWVSGFSNHISADSWPCGFG